MNENVNFWKKERKKEERWLKMWIFERKKKINKEKNEWKCEFLKERNKERWLKMWIFERKKERKKMNENVNFWKKKRKKKDDWKCEFLKERKKKDVGKCKSLKERKNERKKERN